MINENNSINHFFQEAKEEKKEKPKYKRTPKKIRKLILHALKQAGGEIPNDPWHIRMLTSKIMHENNMWIDPYTVYKYLIKSHSVELKNGYFILKEK